MPMRCGNCAEELVATRADNVYVCPRCGQVWQHEPELGQWVRAGQSVGTDRPLDDLLEED
jgi:Zn-finger nucleic acid-binding protein